MKELSLIRKSFKNNPFSSKQAEEIGVARYALSELQREGAVEKIAHGLYALDQGDIAQDEQFRRASIRLGQPSVVCLLSALEYYDLTDIVTKQVWMMVPANKRTRHEDIRVFRTLHFKWKVGVIKRKGFVITSVERTIVDCLTHQRQLPVTIGTEALRRAIQLKKTTLSNIAKMAKELGVFHRIRPYVEALA